MHVTSPLLSAARIRHGFGTLTENVPAPMASEWDRLRPHWNQAHGIRSVEIREPGQQCGDCDALFTSRAGQPIAVRTADCVPILLARRDGSIVAAVHAGWRGTLARALPELWKTLSARGEKPEDWLACVGPAIGPCCYEVSPELAENFRREFPGYGWDAPRPTTRHLDLPTINEGQLRELGIGAVERLPYCTRCAGPEGSGSGVIPAEPLFHSFRREGKGFRQFSVIGIGQSIRTESGEPSMS